MILRSKNIKTKIQRSAFKYWKCGAKTVTFLFWISLYMIAMRLTVFRSDSVETPVQDLAMPIDNYTRWMLNGPVLGDDEPDINSLHLPKADNETAAELDRRAQTVQTVCHKHNLTSQPMNNKEFFVDNEHNLVWCNIFKSASSFWLHKFNILGGYSRQFLVRTRHTPLTLARQKFPRPSVEELKDAINTPGVLSLLVVREPFVRLLSAYRDKLENVSPPYYRKLSRHIVAKYRTKTNDIFGPTKSFGPTFYEFAKYLIDNHNNKTQEEVFDEHWTPYYKFCSPCALNFSVIAKVETLARDSDHVFRELGLSHVLDVREKSRRTRLRTVMNKSRDGKETSALLKTYFSQLDEDILNGLLDIYGIDFELFGYDPKVYTKYIRNNV